MYHWLHVSFSQFPWNICGHLVNTWEFEFRMIYQTLRYHPYVIDDSVHEECRACDEMRNSIMTTKVTSNLTKIRGESEESGHGQKTPERLQRVWINHGRSAECKMKFPFCLLQQSLPAPQSSRHNTRNRGKEGSWIFLSSSCFTYVKMWTFGSYQGE